MSNRYWLGITTDANATSNWSDTDGGGGGLSVPIAGDTAYFTSVSGLGNCTLTVALACDAIINNGTYTGTFDAATYAVTFGTSFTWKGGTLKMGTGIWTVTGAIDFTGATINYQTSTMSFLGTCTLAASTSVTFYTVTIGTAAATVTSLTQSCNMVVINSLTVLNAAATTWVLSGYSVDTKGTFNLTNLDTFTQVAGYVRLSGTSAQTITVGGVAITNLEVANRTTVTFADSLTVTNFRCFMPGATLNFTSGITATFTNCYIDGGDFATPIYLKANTSGTIFTLTVAGKRSFANIKVKDCTATAGTQGKYYAYHGNLFDGGGGKNTNWIFNVLRVERSSGGKGCRGRCSSTGRGSSRGK